MVNFWFKCDKDCGEVLADGEVLSIDLETTKVYEVDTNNNRVTSVEHTPKRCRELVMLRKGNKPRPVNESVMDQFF
jgi:hypothetical protein